MAATTNGEVEEELVDYEEEEAVEEPKDGEKGGQAKAGYAGMHSSGFKDFLLKPELLRAIVDCGFEHPSEGGSLSALLTLTVGLIIASRDHSLLRFLPCKLGSGKWKLPTRSRTLHFCLYWSLHWYLLSMQGFPSYLARNYSFLIDLGREKENHTAAKSGLVRRWYTHSSWTQIEHGGPHCSQTHFCLWIYQVWAQPQKIISLCSAAAVYPQRCSVTGRFVPGKSVAYDLKSYVIVQPLRI